MFSKLSGTGAVALMMCSLVSVEGQNQNRPVRYTPADDDTLYDLLGQKHPDFKSYSCNKCIRSGFTYMYEYLGEEIESSEVFKDLNEFQDYNGVCCNKKRNGDLNCRNAKGDPISTENRPLSSKFKDVNVAIAACPTKRSVCGKKRHFIYDSYSKQSQINVNFEVPDRDVIYIPGSGVRQNFNVEKDECHWLIQTKCDVPVIKFEHQLNGVSKPKVEKLLDYEIDDILSPDYEELDTEFDGEKTADDYLRLGYIEYAPNAVQSVSSKTVIYNGDYPGFDAEPFFVRAGWNQLPGQFGDLRQFVRTGKTDNKKEIERYLDIKQGAGIKNRWFPTELISKNLFEFQGKLNEWDVQRQINDKLIEKYNNKVAAYKKDVRFFREAQKAFYGEDDLRVSQTIGSTPRGRLSNGIIPTLPDAQITDKYTAYRDAYNKAVQIYNTQFRDEEVPSLLPPYPRYSGYNFEDFMPVYGFGLLTAGTINLDDVNYGEYKTFGVFGQMGKNIKEKYNTVNLIKNIHRQILQGDVDTQEEVKELEQEKERLIKSIYAHKKNAGVSLVDSECKSSYMLLSLTPNTFTAGTWNAKSFVSKLMIKIGNEKTDKTRPLTPDFLTYPGRQRKIDEYRVQIPGTIASEDGAMYIQAASIAAASLAALTLF